jgi:pimeloyl-ACP methyl ester carboxylesterase
MERRDVVVDGVRVAVFEAGSGPPVVLLHGYPQSHRCWLRVVPALAQTRRVIAPDWFGWGESERSLACAPRYEDEVRRLVALLDALELPRCDVFAHDYGGLLALALATRHPERVARLALINTRAHRRMAPLTYVQWWLFTWLARIPGIRWLFSRLPWYPLHVRALRRYVKNGSFTSDELDGYVRWMGTPEGRTWFTLFCRHFRVGARSELGSLAEALDVPTAIIWGERDPYFPTAIGEDLARRIKRASLTKLADGDHYIMEQRPDEVAAALLALTAIDA